MNPLTMTVCCRMAIMSKTAASKKRLTARVSKAFGIEVDMIEFEFDEIPLIGAIREARFCVS